MQAGLLSVATNRFFPSKVVFLNFMTKKTKIKNEYLLLGECCANLKITDKAGKILITTKTYNVVTKKISTKLIFL